MAVKKGTGKEIAALEKIKLFAVLKLVILFVFVIAYVGFLLSFFAGDLPVFSRIGYHYSNTGAYSSSFAGNSLSFMHPFLQIIGLFAAIYAVMEIITMILLRDSFRLFSVNDNSFETQARLASVAIILFAVGIILGVIVLLSLFFGIGDVWHVLAILLGVITLILLAISGLLYVIAEVWGLWKVGAKYSNTLIEVSAILLILVGLVGEILLLVGIMDLIGDLSKKSR